MRPLFYLSLIVLVSACRGSITGSGNVITETRSVGNFTAVNASDAIHVEIKKGPAGSVTVEADDNVLPHLITKVSGTTLRISLRDINDLNNAVVNVYVTVPELTGIEGSSAAEIKASDVSSSSKLSLTASSSAKIDVRVDAPAVTLNASSGGEVIAGGRTKNVSAEASSGSTINASKLLAENASGESSSGASVKISGSVSIKGTASSGGSVNYTGGADNVTKNESSGGSVSGGK